MASVKAAATRAMVTAIAANNSPEAAAFSMAEKTASGPGRRRGSPKWAATIQSARRAPSESSRTAKPHPAAFGSKNSAVSSAVAPPTRSAPPTATIAR